MVNQRLRPGNWETDNLGGQTKDQTSVSADLERLFRYTILDKLANRTAQAKADSIIDHLSPFPPALRSTITADCGSENSQHQYVSGQLNTDFYFCHPYHAWEKGAVENSLGRVRRFIPKGTSADQITRRQLKKVQNWLNHTPRKCLDWQTPHEALTNYLTKKGYSTDFLSTLTT